MGEYYPVQAEVGSSGGYSWVRIFVAGVQRYAAVLADRCQLVMLSPGDAFAACVAQGGDAAGQRAQSGLEAAGGPADDANKRTCEASRHTPRRVCRPAMESIIQKYRLAHATGDAVPALA